MKSKMFDTGPFTTEERMTIDRENLWMCWIGMSESAAAGTDIGELRAKFRKEHLQPPTPAKSLASIRLRVNEAMGKIIDDAIDELERLTKMGALRPLSELRQESYKDRASGNGPDRWVIFWGPSGMTHTPIRGVMGRHSYNLDNERRFFRWDGVPVTNDGPEPTHFSELPDDAVALFEQES